MIEKCVSYQKMGDVGKITINRPEADNVINIRMAEDLAHICSEINTDNAIKVVILTGAGKVAFSLGTDLTELGSKDSGGKTALPLVAESIAELKCPAIAAINGDALGQGLEMILACDLRIAVETASFSIPHITSDCIPWDGATQRLPRLIGMAIAMDMVLTGRIIDAKEALRIGLVNKLVPSGKLTSIVDELSQTMVSKSPLALNFIKEAMNKGLDLTLEQGLHLESDLYLLLQTTEDRVEGISAFLEKRQPRFKGK